MINVGIVVTHISHGSPGSFYRPYEFAKHLSQYKINATIFTPFEYDAKNITDVNMKTLLNIGNQQKLNNFTYDILRKIIYNKQLSHIMPYDKMLLSFSGKISTMLEKSISIKPDILQGEQEVASLACINVGKKLGIPVVVDIHNIWPEELVATSHIKRDSQVFKNLMSLESYIVSNANHVIVVNEYMKDYIISNFNIKESKISIIPPGGEVLYKDYNKINEIRFSNKKIIYSGLVNPREHVDLFIRSIPFVSKKFPETKFVVSEKGESIKNIKNLCSTLSISPDFYWYSSRQDARLLLKQCYAGILPSKDDVGRKLGTPLKLLEYMSNGLPIIANDVGSWCNLINDEKIGILTKDNPEHFANAICEILHDEKLFKKMQNNMISLLEKKFSWKNHVETILIPLYNTVLS